MPCTPSPRISLNDYNPYDYDLYDYDPILLCMV